MKNFEFFNIDLTITGSGATIAIPRETRTLDRHCKIHGIAVSSTDEAALVNSTMDLRINKKEIIPVGHEAKKFYANNGVSPNEKYFMLNEPIEVNKAEIEGNFIDGTHYSANYTVRIQFLMETIEN